MLEEEAKLVQGFRFDVTFFLLGITPNPVKTLFRKVSGLSVSMKTDPVGGPLNRIFNLQLPTAVQYSNVTLERGLAPGGLLDSGFSQLLSAFALTPSNVLISLLDEEAQPLNSWLLIAAYPVKWSVSGFDAGNSEVVIESIELTYVTLMPMSL